MLLVPPADHLSPSHVFVGRKIRRQRAKLHVPSILGDELIEHLISVTLGDLSKDMRSICLAVSKRRASRAATPMSFGSTQAVFACEVASCVVWGQG